jgi:hypothetical protein
LANRDTFYEVSRAFQVGGVQALVEREANWARFRVTHWVVPSVPARSP